MSAYEGSKMQERDEDKKVLEKEVNKHLTPNRQFKDPAIIEASMMQVEVTQNIIIPEPPNFIRTDDDKAIPIRSFSEIQLREIAAKWTESLIAKSKKK